MPEFRSIGGASLRRRLPILYFLILLGLLSCAGPSHPTKETKSPHLIKNVPFFPQEAYQCGPASLAGVLNFWGIRVSPEEIAADIYSKSARGTLNLDLILYAQKKGLIANQYRGSWEDIKTKIDSGHPLIVMVDYGMWMVQQNHFMVVVGYQEGEIIANSGKDHLTPISMNDFLKTWKRTKLWTLWITPQQ